MQLLHLILIDVIFLIFFLCFIYQRYIVFRHFVLRFLLHLRHCIHKMFYAKSNLKLVVVFDILLSVISVSGNRTHDDRALVHASS